MSSLLFAAPWLTLLVYMALRMRLPRQLPIDPRAGEEGPLVSVIIPARNEELNLANCVESVGSSEYGRFEIIVVDDRSTDRTAEVARAASPGHATRFEVVSGEELPEGWMGKPWACAQGAQVSRGDVLLFTDADTTHHPELLGRALATLFEDGVDAVTLMGSQLMESFWERVVQPHVFFTLALGFPDIREPPPPKRWRRAVANGQFILIHRSVYDEIGGHDSVRGDVVEDQRLAQVLCVSGKYLAMRLAEEHFATRMYRSLPDLVEGWSKNVALAARQSVPGWLRPVALPGMITWGVIFWLAPPLVVVLGFAGVSVGVPVGVAQAVTAGSALFWCAVTWRAGAPPWYGLLYPLGAAISAYIFARSWRRGTRVEWKGREYEVSQPSVSPPSAPSPG